MHWQETDRSISGSHLNDCKMEKAPQHWWYQTLAMVQIVWPRAHGRPHKFFPGGVQRRHFAYPFSNCEWCNANGPSQNALPFLQRRSVAIGGARRAKTPYKIFLPRLKKYVGHSFKNLGPSQKTLRPQVSQAGYGPATPQRKFPMKARAPFAFFEIVFRWSCIRVCEKVVDYFLSSFSRFCWIGLSFNVIIIVNCRQFQSELDYVCGAHISQQCEPHFSKFSLTLKCFLHFVYQKCFFSYTS